jgi:hypothetical protein
MMIQMEAEAMAEEASA